MSNFFESLEPRAMLSGDFNFDGKPDIVWHNEKTGENAAWIYNNGVMSSAKTLPGLGDFDWEMVAIADVNDDFHGDIVWRNNDTGQNVVWYFVSGSFISSQSIAAEPDLDWEIRAVGIIDETDLFPDIMWRNKVTGANRLWRLDLDANVLQTINLKAEPDLNWTVVDAADFDGTGRENIFWWNRATGATRYWTIKPDGSFNTETQLPTINDTLWVPIEAGDYNSDLGDDIVYRHRTTGAVQMMKLKPSQYLGLQAMSGLGAMQWTAGVEDRSVGVDFNKDNTTDLIIALGSSGSNKYWSFKGGVFTQGTNLPSLADTNWTMVASADFDQNGSSDLLWRNKVTGQNTIWLLNNNAFVSAVGLPVLATTWEVVGAGDMNGDWLNDIVFYQPTTGNIVTWTLNKTTFVSSIATGTFMGAGWKLVGLGDLDEDKKNDLIWHNTNTGQVTAWYMNYTVRKSAGALKAETDGNWKLAGLADLDRDGNLDLVWRNTSTGANRYWKMKDQNYVSTLTIPTELNQGWQFVV